jgi:mitochondrial translocator assembly and maintenance protein 41
VTKQVVHFRRLYSPLLDTLPNVTISEDHIDPSYTILKQDYSPHRRANMVARLPSGFKSIVYKHYQRKFKIQLGQVESGDAFGGDFEMKVAADEGLGGEMKRSIRETVGWVSFVQTVKGLFSAGVGRSVKYVVAKIGKWWSGKAGSTTKPGSNEK